MPLKDILYRFEGANNEADLQNLFYKLAQTFLYGGYIQVRNDYRVYIRTVEFYFHSEKMEGIHDPIVYHRNIRDLEGNVLEKVPYFPVMSLHAHTSGYDITFESEIGEYRSSALIRSYEVKDMDGKYLLWDKEKGLFIKSENYGYNTQSTYLYLLLNGFSLSDSNDIKWVNLQRIPSVPVMDRRSNVFQSKNEWKYIKTSSKCERKWSFTRQEIV